MDPDIVELKVTLATLTEQVASLKEAIERQERDRVEGIRRHELVLESYGEQIKYLTSLADRGKGSVWILISIGSGVGLILANLKSIATFILR